MISRKALPAEFLVRFCALQYHPVVENNANRPGSSGQARVWGQDNSLIRGAGSYG
jgi:hypothetical protein